MKLVKMAWVLGGLTAFGFGVAAEGCSSNQGTTDLAGGTNCAALSACCMTLGADASQCAPTLTAANDASCATFLASIVGTGRCTGSGTGAATSTTGSGASTTAVGSTTTSSGFTTTTTTSAGSTGSGTCEAPPTQVYAETTAGVYCPFSGLDGGKNLYCSSSQHCCEPAAGEATCTATGTACAAMSSDWQCEGAPDCAGTSGTVCCGTGTVTTDPTCPNSPYVSGFSASTCSASCTGTTFQVCSATSECTGGTTCTPIKVKGNDIGYCK